MYLCLTQQRKWRKILIYLRREAIIVRDPLVYICVYGFDLICVLFIYVYAYIYVYMHVYIYVSMSDTAEEMEEKIDLLKERENYCKYIYVYR
jgi:hypothetical protein